MVLPYINMNQPQVYMCAPSPWNLLLTPSLCITPEHWLWVPSFITHQTCTGHLFTNGTFPTRFYQLWNFPLQSLESQMLSWLDSLTRNRVTNKMSAEDGEKTLLEKVYHSLVNEIHFKSNRKPQTNFFAAFYCGPGVSNHSNLGIIM